MSNGKIAKLNERVVVNRDFSIVIPAGYKYSLDSSEIGSNRSLVFIKTERNEYFDKEYGDFDEFGLDEPFGAPQCCTALATKCFGGQLDLSDANLREALKSFIQPVASMFGGTCTTIKEKNDILVYYSKFVGKQTNVHFFVVTPENLYSGQIFLNDTSTQKERERIAKEWLNSIESYTLTDDDKIPSKPFVVPTYNENKREQMASVTVAVPDQVKTLVAMANTKPADILVKEKFEEEFAFLAINKDFDNPYIMYSDADFIIKATNDNIKTLPGLDALWGEEKKAERKKTFTNLIKNSLQGIPYKLSYKEIEDKLAVVYTQVDESTDNIEQWANYFVVFFHNASLIQVNIHIKAILDLPTMEKAIAEWALSVKSASEAEIKKYNEKRAKQVLGILAGKNGKIDGIKATQLFFEDIFFFVKGQIQSKGKHHILNGLQMNAAVLDDFPQIKENPAIYGTALTELLNFVEEDELLVLDPECVHCEFDKLNKVDLPIINGVPMDVKEAKIGKGLSGIRAFLLIAWHMAKIVENEPNKFVVALDQNMYRGIPDAQMYICQLIKRLREYNDIHDAFEVVFASTFNCDGGLDGAISGRNPIQGVRNGFEAVYVAENENPYEKVQKQIAEAKEKGVWKTWERGKNATEDDDLDDLIIEPFEKDLFDDEAYQPEFKIKSKSESKKSNPVSRTVLKEDPKAEDYEKAKKLFKNASTPSNFKTAKKAFVALKGYFDSENYIKKCDSKISELEEKEKQRKLEIEAKKKEKLAAKEHMEKTVAECNAKVEEFGKILDLALENHMTAFKNKLKSKIQRLENERNERSTYLSTLGFFKFSEKSEVKKTILRIDDELERLNDPDLVQQEKTTVKKACDKALRDYSEQVKNHLSSRFPDLNPKSKKPNIPAGDDGMKLQILLAMAERGGRWTITRICEDLGIEINQKASSLVRQLKEAGEVTRTEEKGRAYYSLAVTKASVLDRVYGKKTAPTYKEIEKFANEGCPEVPDVKDIKLPKNQII